MQKAEYKLQYQIMQDLWKAQKEYTEHKIKREFKQEEMNRKCLQKHARAMFLQSEQDKLDKNDITKRIQKFMTNPKELQNLRPGQKKEPPKNLGIVSGRLRIQIPPNKPITSDCTVQNTNRKLITNGWDQSARASHKYLN